MIKSSIVYPMIPTVSSGVFLLVFANFFNFISSKTKCCNNLADRRRRPTNSVPYLIACSS
ncbi:hypothetical protein P280DRAFT_149672 [Massarina eburnea CBS 473.64]|uniref:Uncharacterized protein n=1 Tax=Massarina eburnea CBS 473.64 TaxID=1395130 RepID=A0A6A6RPK8_9PLEO|nr:hypothetical protein P280DRAFT_149672 [Massarina eburnea CBS 473.64]